ncbi:MAG: glutamate--tRNA ligase [bacterium]
MSVVVRFAPSPTGYLHVGGARTALFNWLFARHNRGKFLLRIEDTDRERSTPQAVEAIFAGLRWLELDWDDEPLFQSQRLEAHQELVQQLLKHSAAYRCFCAPEELARLQKQTNQPFGYPGICRNLTQEEVEAKLAAGSPCAVRFKTPPGETVFQDAVHGEIRTPNQDISDFIILRRDGTPVYQVAVVADDLYMGITHVIRGDDHITNTPKQILLYQALGEAPPQFAHIPLILGTDKKRLSKRHGATSVTEYRDRGILPEAMCNFLALLGWNPGDDREIMSLAELTAAFSLEGVNSSGAVFDEAKLEWMNGKYIREMSAEEIWRGIEPFLRDRCIELQTQPPSREFGLKLASLYRERLLRFADAPQQMEFFLQDPTTWDEQGFKKNWKLETPKYLEILQTELQNLATWDREHLEAVIDHLAESLQVKRGLLIHPVRLAVTGRTASPGIFEVLELLGKDTILHRIERFMERL